jgi:nucleotidyltransferase/DNA polymerase involved in DNA repair
VLAPSGASLPQHSTPSSTPTPHHTILARARQTRASFGPLVLLRISSCPSQTHINTHTHTHLDAQLSNLVDASWRCIHLAGAQICAEVRAAVREATNFSCSGGISHNKMLSKLASARNKPDKQTIVPLDGVQDLIKTLPLEAIRGSETRV